ncbi:MAG: hypothetical protein AAF721_21345 [Myxococcota bacterium]
MQRDIAAVRLARVAGLATLLAIGCSDDDRRSVWGATPASGGGADTGPGAGDGIDDDDGDGGAGGEDNDGGGGPDDDGGDGGTKLDVGDHNPDAPPLDACGCELTYIWVANSSEGTVSKINVRTLVEEGRYITRPDGDGDPSRTSVNLAADVAVANRYGGLVKIYADESDCVESNGMPGIQTSTGAGDVLPWGVEECVAWYREFPTTNQRPVAWTPGQVTEGSCDSTGEQVWTVTSTMPGIGPGLGGPGGVTVHLLDGASGGTVQQIQIDDFPGFNLGAYGGAVNGEGDLFFTPMGLVSIPKVLARVELSTYEVTLWELPAEIAPYGITVDHNGMVWVSSTAGPGAARFDPDTETWDVIPGFSSLGGLAEGEDDLMWIADQDGLISINIEDFSYGPRYLGPSKGVSIDVDGYVWSVDNAATKIDPETALEVGTYEGLSGPYTYSDMTGHALGNVTCPPPEG